MTLDLPNLPRQEPHVPQNSHLWESTKGPLHQATFGTTDTTPIAPGTLPI